MEKYLNQTEEQLTLCLTQYAEKYPKAEIADFIKLLYQATHGGGHMIQNPKASLDRLKEEISFISQEGDGGCVIENLPGDYSRLYLTKEMVVNVHVINRIFIASNTSVPEKAKECLKNSLTVFLKLCKENKLPFDMLIAKRQVDKYAEKGYPMLSHSEGYRDEYKPAYRVVKKKYARFLNLFIEIQRLLDEKGAVGVAIDGNSGAGKSSLAELIEDIFNCNIFHSDDFFLPPKLRTEERLEEVGGNMDYKRFEEEICKNVKKDEPFSYTLFDCSVMKINGEVHVIPKKLNIFEGSYTHHPSLRKYYDLMVFLSIDPSLQKERILKRNGEEMLTRFLSEWIPKENRYFSEMRIPERADIIYSMTFDSGWSESLRF